MPGLQVLGEHQACARGGERVSTLAAPLALAAPAAAGAAFLGAEAWRRWALRRGIVDAPEARRLNAVATPRGGGVGLAAVLAAAALVLPGTGPLIALGLVVTAGVGLADDLRPLPPWAKALGQGAGAAPLAWALPLALPSAPPLAGVAAAWLVVVAAVNVWNFMDGSDGLAATQAMLAGLALGWLAAGPAAAFAMLLAAACLGFLPLNLPRARVFLGDVGSHALGYAIATLVLLALQGPAWPWLPAVPVSAFLVDAGLTLAKRALRGERVWRAHREHLYQRAIAAGHGHGRVCAAYALWTAGACAAAIVLEGAPPPRAAAGAAALFAAAVLVRTLLGRRWPRSVAVAEPSR